MPPCLRWRNSSFILLISAVGMCAFLNFSENSAQPSTCPAGRRARTPSHQLLAVPARQWVAYRTFSLLPTAATARLFSMVRSQSSASRGSFVCENTGGLVFWKSRSRDLGSSFPPAPPPPWLALVADWTNCWRQPCLLGALHEWPGAPP